MLEKIEEEETQFSEMEQKPADMRLFYGGCAIY